MIVQANILDWCKTYDGPPYHALLADPPYHLTDPRDPRRGFPHRDEEGWSAPGRKGFMGKDWDGGDTAFRPETWAAIAQHLYPGAFLMVFAGTRGYHRMACAIEDAGLIIHPAIGWGFGSGFPKATRVPDSRFEGHRYGLQALKPAFEFIAVAQKPYAGRPVDCITQTGAGALNIDGGRIPADENCARTPVPVEGAAPFGHSPAMGGQGHDGGRWPANLALSHAPACTAERCDPSCAVERLGAQSGVSSSPTHVKQGKRTGGSVPYGSDFERTVSAPGDEGTAARYFYNADWMYERLEAADAVRYEAKASTAEREAGLGSWAPTTVDDGRQTPIDNPYLRGETQRRNIHPTVKPISLIKWLATLLLPPTEYAPRRLLIPFAGVGSEYIGAHLAGWEAITGVELEADHVAIGNARIDWWRTAARRLMTTDVETILRLQDEADTPSLLDLLDAA